MYEHITRHHIKITHLNSLIIGNENEKTKLNVKYNFEISEKKEEIFLRLWQIARTKYVYDEVFCPPLSLSLSQLSLSFRDDYCDTHTYH